MMQNILNVCDHSIFTTILGRYKCGPAPGESVEGDDDDDFEPLHVRPGSRRKWGGGGRRRVPTFG